MRTHTIAARAATTLTGAAAALAMVALAAPPALADPGVSPAAVDEALDPGQSTTITKTVQTPVIPPRPDVVLVVDRTGSMGPFINNVKAQMADVITTVRAAQPDAQFAVTSYCDEGEPDPFLVMTDLSADPTTITDAVDDIALCGGGDGPEAQLNALWEIGDGGDAITFRPGSSRVVAWFGDAPGHDPSFGHTLADATSSLTGVDAKVVAVSVGVDNLDLTGQATALTTATSGVLLSGVTAGEVADKIVEGLTSLPVTVTGTPVCDDGLSVSLDPASRTVTSGTAATFEETITVAADAPEGAVLGCTTSFSLNGVEGGPEFVQSISVEVNDVTAPVVSCPAGPNPKGKIPAGTNEDGFFRMVATDNLDPDVDITVTDPVSGTTYGPYGSGTTFKLTQDPEATPSVRAFQGAVDWRFILNGDALLTATDDAGNTSTATCLVPPND